MYRLKVTEPRKPFDEVDADDSSSDDEYANETEDERRKQLFYCIFILFTESNQFIVFLCVQFVQSIYIERRVEFELRRKKHYNEFEAIKLARKLIEEDEEEDETGNDGEGTSKTTNDAGEASGSSSHEQSTSHSSKMTDDNS